MTAESPPSAVSHAIGALVAVVLTAGIVVGGWLLVSKPRDPPPRPEAGDVLLSTRLEMPVQGGASFRVRVRAPGTLRFAIDAGGSALNVSFGVPPRPEASSGDIPDPATAVSWSVGSDSRPHEERVYAAGLYVLSLNQVLAEPMGGTQLVLPTPMSVEIREVSNR